MLKDIDIRSVANDAAYDRGLAYYRKGAVRDIQVGTSSGGIVIFGGNVVGNADTYEARAYIKGDHIEDWSCTCPAASMYPGACKHVVALLKQIQEKQRKEDAVRSTRISRKETNPKRVR